MPHTSTRTHDSPQSGSLQAEISQQVPFESIEQEFLLSIMRSADVLHRALMHRLRPWNLSSPQYNVLRILRGASPHGLSCSQIGQRMITAEPDITRLLSRLKARKLVEQHRDRRDRRVVLTHISKTGLQLLKDLDHAVTSMPQELLRGIPQDQLREMIDSLAAMRTQIEPEEHPPICDGTHKKESTTATN